MELHEGQMKTEIIILISALITLFFLFLRDRKPEPPHFICSYCPDRDRQEAQLVGKTLTHGICPSCFEKQMTEARKFNAVNPILK